MIEKLPSWGFFKPCICGVYCLERTRGRYPNHYKVSYSFPYKLIDESKMEKSKEYVEQLKKDRDVRRWT